MKKLICVILSVMMILSLTACGAQEAAADKNAGVQTEFSVAIVQQLDHSSLDEIREAVKAQLTALAEPGNYTITIKEYNGQNDASMLNQIGTQEQENAKLKEKTEAAGTLEGIKDIAREELGMVDPGTVIIDPNS